MKLNFVITAGIAASLLSSIAAAQTATTPRARSAQVFTVQKGSGSYLGIGGMEVTSERAKALNLKEERGVEVSSVDEDGPAAKAGLKVGDVVLEFNGTPVQSAVQFQRLVSELPPGRQVKLTVWRNGASQTLTAAIGERKNAVTSIVPGDSHTWSFDMPDMPKMQAMPRMPEFRNFEMLSPNPALGVYGEALAESEQLAEFFGVTDGVLVRSVRKNSPAEKAGIKAGDVITKIDDTRISNSMDITRTLRGMKGKKTFNVTVVRNKKETPISVTVETAGNTTRASLIVVNC
jgi:serine protease Do